MLRKILRTSGVVLKSLAQEGHLLGSVRQTFAFWKLVSPEYFMQALVRGRGWYLKCSEETLKAGEAPMGALQKGVFL